MVLNGILMSGDTPVAEIRHGSVMPLEKTRMPLYLRDHDDILGWLEERAIDRHRTNSRILKKILRLSDSSDLAAVLHSHGAAITDDYWFKGEAEPDLTWRDVCFSADSFASDSPVITFVASTSIVERERDTSCRTHRTRPSISSPRASCLLRPNQTAKTRVERRAMVPEK